MFIVIDYYNEVLDIIDERLYNLYSNKILSLEEYRYEFKKESDKLYNDMKEELESCWADMYLGDKNV